MSAYINFEYGIDLNRVQVNDNSTCPHSLKNVLRHIRNSIAHGNFKQVKIRDGQIESLMFQDFNPHHQGGNKIFELEIKFDKFRKFAIKVATEVLETR